jgi:aspartate carbamoyltransferase catalytic subunit
MLELKEPQAPAVDNAATWRAKDLLDTDVLSREEIDLVMETAEAMREVRNRPNARLGTLRGVTMITLFYEQSTRTRASFEVAGKALGADVVNLTATGSSVEKGESLIDTVRTLEAIGADIVVMRHKSSGAPYLAARHSSASVINGGDGTHAHPTQALLDLFTMRQHLGDLAGRRSRSSAMCSTAASPGQTCGPFSPAEPTSRSAGQRRSSPAALRGAPSGAAWNSPRTSTKPSPARTW